MDVPPRSPCRRRCWPKKVVPWSSQCIHAQLHGVQRGYYDPTGYDNDVFRPMHVGVESYEMMVFTKWGEMIFFTNDVMVGWDGYIDGKLAPTMCTPGSHRSAQQRRTR